MVSRDNMSWCLFREHGALRRPERVTAMCKLTMITGSARKKCLRKKGKVTLTWKVLVNEYVLVAHDTTAPRERVWQAFRRSR